MRWFIRRRLKSPDAETRKEAIELLSHKATVDEIQLFAHALQDENAAVRSAAAYAVSILRETAPRPCIQVVLPWLQDADFSLRMSGAIALDLLGWRPSNSEERVLNAIALGNFNSITPQEEAGLGILLPLLKTGSDSTRFAVVQTLEQLELQDPQIVQPLIDLLKDSSLPVRVTALQALGNTSDERRLTPLLAKLKDDAPQIRAVAAEALGKTGDAQYLPKILPLLKDAKFDVRLAAISALGRIKSPEALAPIISMLADSDSDVRKCAVESLGRLQDPRSVKALIEMMVDSETGVRHATANALQVVRSDWQSSREAQEAIPFFQESLKHEEYSVRDAAGKLLKRISVT